MSGYVDGFLIGIPLGLLAIVILHNVYPPPDYEKKTPRARRQCNPTKPYNGDPTDPDFWSEK